MVTSFWIHIVVLYVTSVLIGKKNRKYVKGIFFAALLCTVIDTVVMFYTVRLGYVQSDRGVYIGVACAEFVLAARIAYGRQRCIQNGILLLCISALMAGVFLMIPIRNIGLFCLTGTLFLPILLGGIATLFRTKQTGTWMYEAKLYQKEEEKTLSAFMDTGNRLRLYGSCLPVVLVDEQYLNEWIKTAEYEMPQKIVFVPYKGVGGKGLLKGIRLRLELTVSEEKIINGEVAAVAAEHRLFWKCSYQMILQPEVLTMTCVINTREGVQNVI